MKHSNGKSLLKKATHLFVGAMLTAVVWSFHAMAMGEMGEQRMSEKVQAPPVGTWAAVYTAEFAKKYNLPPENITNELTPPVQYMEMDMLDSVGGRPACWISMLVTQGNDIAYHENTTFAMVPENQARWMKFNERRILLHYITQIPRPQLEPLSGFSVGSTDYRFDKSGFMTSASTFMVREYAQGYDYITMSGGGDCVELTVHQDTHARKMAIIALKASVWGKERNRFKTLQKDSPVNDLAESEKYIYLQIPQALIDKFLRKEN